MKGTVVQHLMHAHADADSATSPIHAARCSGELDRCWTQSLLPDAIFNLAVADIISDAADSQALSAAQQPVAYQPPQTFERSTNGNEEKNAMTPRQLRIS